MITNRHLLKFALRFLMLVCAGAASLLLVPPAISESAVSTDYVQTVREGISYRLSAASTVNGTAEYEYQFSPTVCASIRAAAEENARNLALMTEVLPLDPIQRSQLEFGYASDERVWRCAMTDITNSGHMSWASSSGSPVLNRHLSPDTFYRETISDGRTVYVYSRSVATGRILSVGPETRMSEPLVYVKSVIRGVSEPFAQLLDRSGSVPTYEGQENVDGHDCLKIAVRPEDPSAGGWMASAWIAPDLDFAAVREERTYFLPPDAVGAPPKLERVWTVHSMDFARVSHALWCAQTVHIELNDHKASPAEPWEYSQTIRLQSFTLNTPVDVSTPYSFPDGTIIVDSRVEPPAISIPEGKRSFSIINLTP